ncbi:MAG: methyl-accepting chemotaxis protein, partial [Actinomycetia bacterium]|nr:methyl-accepting chemotaxis protein [Actinomycetes bacterium]
MNTKHPFDRQVPTRNRYDEFFIMNKDGQVIVSTNADNIDKSPSNSAFFTQAQDGEVTIVDAYKESDTKAVFGFSAPIYHESLSSPDDHAKENVIGYFGAKVDTGMLALIMTGELGNLTGGQLFFAGYSKNLDMYIMNKEGLMISQSRITSDDTVLKKKGSAEPLKRALDMNAKGARMTNAGLETGAREVMEVYNNHDDQQVAGASMVVFDQLWTVVIEENTADAFAAIIQLKNTFAVAGILMIFLVIGVGYVLSRRIVRPLSDISTAADHLANGDLESQVDGENANFQEAAFLGQAFNKMARNLKTMVESEKNVKEHLESLLGNIKFAIEDIASASTEIFAASSQHNAGATEQAASISQTATTVDEVRQTAEQTNERAQTVASSAEKSVKISDTG